MKRPLKYKDQVVGYLNYAVYEKDVLIKASFFLWNTGLYEEIISNINKSIYVELHDIEYEFNFENNLLTLNKKYENTFL